MVKTLPELNKTQIEKLSDISSDIALVALASVVLPSLFDRYDPAKILTGVVAMFFFWIVSIWLRR